MSDNNESISSHIKSIGSILSSSIKQTTNTLAETCEDLTKDLKNSPITKTASDLADSITRKLKTRGTIQLTLPATEDAPSEKVEITLAENGQILSFTINEVPFRSVDKTSPTLRRTRKLLSTVYENLVPE